MFDLNLKPKLELNWQEEYLNILKILNPLYPGRGKDFFWNKNLDSPMSYALILSAEVSRYHRTKSYTAYYFIERCGFWLLKNKDLNQNKIAGYGLPVAWDAFQDNTFNPPHTEYTITSAIAVKSLLDWMTIKGKKLPYQKIKETVTEIFKPYLDDKNLSPTGLFPYSLHNYDRLYNVINPSAFLAGQMQRFTTFLPSLKLKRTLEQKSEKIMSILIDLKKTDPEGNWYWNYMRERNRPNDLIHAAYTIEGIRNYKIHGGSKFSLAKWKKIINHLKSFYLPNHKQWLRYPYFVKNLRKMPLRLWDLGMALHIASQEKSLRLLTTDLLDHIVMLYNSPGKYYFSLHHKRIYIRHLSHLLFGLSSYLFHEKS